MKKLISLIMSAMLLGLPLYGCNKANNPNDVTEETTPETIENPTNENATEVPGTPDSNLPAPGVTGDGTAAPGTGTTTPGTGTATPGTGTTQPSTNNNTQTPAAGDTNKDVNQASGDLVTDILNSTNAERQKQGLQPLKLNSEVSKLAAMKSKDMHDKNYFSHTSPTYGDPGKMLTDNGLRYSAMGENIYTSTGMTPTGAYTVNQWMNSPGHRANILSNNYDEIGIGVYYNNGKYYATQIFYKA
ncbi:MULTISPECIES: CAP domain-containing protein [Clostridium]|uniref:CAP domain-containing protein n=1 Tax=Clostridium TaxID=1485 RepID=UPI001EEE077A|nr:MULTISPECIES: CAP domain-containing protein [Clostridium]